MMEAIMNQNFTNETIGFDGFAFAGCTFTDCVILITGPDFSFEHCSFYNTIFYVKPDLPVFEVAHRLSQSNYDSDTGCFWTDVYKDTGKLVNLPLAELTDGSRPRSK